ncbi:VTT domain-containing protein [Brooklawnia cerclae]|uniref:Membrane-associated protein n=1 Tax=Brooklawnia cerclae TaxID=349934 RepID=A0ABX0SCQ1_9ACTN|nr:VTT domain-containing protein [Brooklawnia cerclae]NIH56178.1 membrane-associated protein [Brooklawnia cerclae]
MLPVPLTDPAALLAALGPYVLIGVFVMVFIESGCLFPFLPGDSLLFTAALMHGQLGIPLWALLAVAIGAAFLGDQVGYLLGARLGRRLFKPEARILKTEYLERSERFFRRHGVAAIVLARFVPIVRTFTPVSAGGAGMDHRRFSIWNLLGGVGWVVIMSLAGLTLGSIPFVARHLDVMATLIVVVSVLPMAIGALSKSRKATVVDADDRAADETVGR